MKATGFLCVAAGLLAWMSLGCEGDPKTRTISPDPDRPLVRRNAQLVKENKKLSVDLEKATGDNADLRTERQQLRSDLTEAQRLAAKASELVRKQQAEAKKAEQEATKAFENLQGEKQELVTSMTKLQGLVKQLTDRINRGSKVKPPTAAELAKAQETVKSLKQARANDARTVQTLRQEVAKRDEKITALEMRLAGKTGAKMEPVPVTPGQTPPAAGDVKITGRLILVRGDMGRIDVGTALGVKRGMKLAIYRADKFVAFFQVSEVTERSAGGFIVARKLDPKVGDRVSSPAAVKEK